MKIVNIFLLILLPFLCIAQLQDDFSDGDFTNNPTWTGNTDRYIVNAENELQLNHTDASGTSTSYLSTVAPTADNTTWEFYIRQEFSPSTSNFAKVYLKSNSSDLTTDVNGYFLQIGGISGTDDAIELFRQDGSSDELLISGTTGAAGTEPVIARIRVERDVNANWSLSVDYTGGTDYVLQGTANDATYNISGFFGWTNRYTATRSDKFFLDDLLINPLYEDTQSPQLLSASAISNTNIDVFFDEGIAAVMASNFSLDNGISVNSASVDGTNSSLVHLTVSPELQNLQTYTVTAENISDLNGNVLITANTSFNFLIPEIAEVGDIIITEIMADPSPEVGLPNAEFFEIYNNSDKIIDLETIFMSSGGSPSGISSFLLEPNEYVVVCDDSNEDLFSEFSNVAIMSSFPALSNAGDNIQLTNSNGILESIDYTDDWYVDDTKNEGGWTLERIDVETIANCQGNWRASQNTIGGTPAAMNSVEGQFFDNEAARLVSVIPLNVNTLSLTFSESINKDEAEEVVNYSVAPSVNILSATLQAPENKEVVLTLDPNLNLQTSTIYELIVLNTISDCMGNSTDENQRKFFGLPESVEVNDVVINEILFNPRTGGADYVELYNRSDKIITATFYESSQFQMLPDAYLVFSEKPDTILARFNVANPDNLYWADLPSLNNDEGIIDFTVNGQLIDEFSYSETQHYELLKDENGVALERINPNADTNDEGNWHSAAASVGYGTPTAQNSQLFLSEIDNTVDFFQIPNPRLSPDEDGFEDVLVINYAFDQIGFTANVKIFDGQGRIVKELVNNQLLGTQGSLKWDGSTDAKSKARVGIYVIWAEIFNPDGRVEMQREAVVLAGQL